jgi:hypothetical protein
MNKLTVIYSLSTLPYITKNPNGVFKIDRFELYTAALSSLTRRRAGNRTVMYCDTLGADYLNKVGISDLWDELLTAIPDDLNGINPKMFWAAGKLFALNAAECPVLMLDTDFIAWQLPELTADIVAAHSEPLDADTYPPIGIFNMKRGYEFNPRFDYTLEPLNTAFIYMNNQSFKQEYVHRALEFMNAAVDCDECLTYMVYAEQRLLPMLAKLHGISVDTIMSYDELHNQRRYTHTWGAKRIMRGNPKQYGRFCEKCRQRIMSDFPEREYIISKIEENS